MTIHHTAILAYDIERLKEFYIRYFGAQAGARYHNPVRELTSYFLTFPGGGATLELMNVPGIIDAPCRDKIRGLCHIAVSTGSREKVDELTALMRAHGITVIGEPRTTGDGYYESVVADPEGNHIELTV